MSLWIPIVCFILILIAIPIAVIIKLKTNKDIKKIDVTANMPIIENDYRKEFTDGYTLGVLKSMTPCKNGTSFIEFFPIDVEQREDIPRPPLQSFIILNEFIKPFAIGEGLSTHRQRIKTITRNPASIPEKMRDTTEGKWATKEGQLAHLTKTFGKAISGGDEAIDEVMKTYARGNPSKNTLAQIKMENKIVRKLYSALPQSVTESIDEKNKK